MHITSLLPYSWKSSSLVKVSLLSMGATEDNLKDSAILLRLPTKADCNNEDLTGHLEDTVHTPTPSDQVVESIHLYQASVII